MQIFLFIFDQNSHKYNNLTALVDACKLNEQRGLACLLTEVCIKPRSTNALAEEGCKWDIPRGELHKDKELGRGNFGIVYKGNLIQGKLFYVVLYQIVSIISNPGL